MSHSKTKKILNNVGSFLWQHRSFFGVFLVLASKNLFPWMLDNEQIRMPLLKQFMNPSWLPNDWMLNLKFDYKILFSIIFGPLTYLFSMETTAFIGRLFTCISFSIISEKIGEKCELKPSFIILWIWAYISYPSIGANEWIIKGFESKVPSYLCVLAAMLFLLESRLILASLLAGLAISFHGQSGCYSFPSFFILALPLFIKSDPKTKRVSLFLFFLGASIGIVTLIKYFSSNLSGLQHQFATELHVYFRHPHHILVDHWNNPHWRKYWGGILVTLILSLGLINRTKAAFSVLKMAWVHVGFFILGIICFQTGNVSLMKPFWFRSADTLLPYIGFMLFFLLIQDFIFNPSEKYLSKIKKDDWIIYLKFIPFFFCALVLVKAAEKFYQTAQFRIETQNQRTAAQVDSDTAAVLTWIKSNTPQDALFLTDPYLEPFHMIAERGRFVSFKGDTYTDSDSIERYNRMVICNRSQKITGRGFDAANEIRNNYNQLSDLELILLSKEYNLRYYLGSPNRSHLNFPSVFRNGRYGLYDLANGSSKNKGKK